MDWWDCRNKMAVARRSPLGGPARSSNQMISTQRKDCRPESMKAPPKIVKVTILREKIVGRSGLEAPPFRRTRQVDQGTAASTMQLVEDVELQIYIQRGAMGV